VSPRKNLFEKCSVASCWHLQIGGYFGPTARPWINVRVAKLKRRPWPKFHHWKTVTNCHHRIKIHSGGNLPIVSCFGTVATAVISYSALSLRTVVMSAWCNHFHRLFPLDTSCSLTLSNVMIRKLAVAGVRGTHANKNHNNHNPDIAWSQLPPHRLFCWRVEVC
jgi:hypothetical protein